MHKIDHPTATPGGLFTIGDPVGGVQATVVTADWLNAVQAEIANAIEGMGLTLDKPNNEQLKEALSIVTATGFITGDVVMTLRPVASAGWIICDDGTIGAPASGASTRANDDCWPLYDLIWTNVADAYAPVSGGRGASAEVDWAANKAIGLTKMLGRVLGVAGDAGDGLTARALGLTTGSETHTLTEAQMPSHNHAATVNDPGHVHQGGNNGDVETGLTTFNGIDNGRYDSTRNNIIRSATTGITVAIDNTGGDGAHNNMQPTAFLYAHIKL